MAANDALVLSGGASQGDFEVGAVRRLFELGFQPGLIVATSVGSVNAVKLVESGALATTGQPSGLEQIWLGLAGNDSMYTNNPAFNLPSLQAVTGNNPENILEGDTIAAFVSGVASLVGIPFAGLAAVALLANLGLDLKKAGQDLTQFLQQLQQSLLSAQSIYTLDPIKTLLNNANILNPNHVDSSSIKLLLAMVSLETGDLRFVNQHGVLLEADTKTPHLETGAVPQKCQKLADDVTAALDNLQGIGGPGDYPTVAAYQAALGAAKAALQKARLALAACEQQNPQSPQQVVVAVPDAVLASASIPFVFPPVKLGHDNYVDGGVRQTVPISGAIAAGATNVWAVTANHVSVSPLPVVDQLTKATITSYDHASCLQIAQRAAEDIMSAQIEQDNMAPLVAWGSATVTVVQPEDGTVPPDIHTGFTVDPGLIRMAHGYMRTDDVNTAGELRGNRWADVADQISQLLFTTEIVNLRYQIWLCEFEFHLWNLVMTPFGTVLAPNPQPAAGSPNALLAEIRQMKQQLQQLLQLLMMGVNLDGSLIVLDRPIQGAVPDQPVPLSDWWLKWEAHQFPTPGEPWDSTTPFTPPPLPLIMPQINWSTTGTSGQQVDVMEISEFTQGASVYYTTNGTDPTTSSTLYRVAVQIAAGTTVKARAFTADGKSSPIATSVAPSPH